MSFISLEFIALFLCCFLAFYCVGKPNRKYVLLASSFVFIGYIHVLFLVVALGITLFTYAAGRGVESARKGKHPSYAYAASIGTIILFWIACRYAQKITGNSSFIFPLGISFYSFQAIAYLTEIYWEEEKAERNLPDFMIYMLFFMKFLSGPIERPGDLLPQIRNLRPATYETMTYGLKLIVVGLMKKLVIADQMAPYIDGIFNSAHTASGVQLLMACLLYPIELYADFSGYTDIALGGARLFGLELSPNFNHPFAAQTTADFWRRWHMSLSFWVRDYVYAPLTSALRQWGQWGIVTGLLITFVVLGLWHGSGWTFVVYGFIQGAVIVYELKTQGFHRTLKKWMGAKLFTVFSIVRTYLIFSLSLLFFRCASIGDAFYFIRHLSFQINHSWKEINLGMSDHICIVAGAALVLMLVFDCFMSHSDLLKRMEKLPTVIRWCIYYLVVFSIFTFGKIGAENFIYLQF